MNPREKILLAIVGGVLVLLAGRGLKIAYDNKRTELDGLIKNKQKQVGDIQAKRDEALRAQAEWRRIGKQSLSMDEKEAKTLLRDELVDLANAAGLPNAAVDLGMVRSWSRNGLRVLNSSMKAEGPLKSILKFLFELHRQPYLVRCKSLTMEPVESKAGGGDRPRTPTGRFTLAIKLETLILPATAPVPVAEPAVLTKGKRQAVARTALARLEDYEAAIKQDLFEPYKPPIPPPGKAAGPSPGHTITVALTPNLNLIWQPGAHAKQHQVHFGESAPGTPQGIMTASTYKPNNLVIDKIYYWRVDEINESGTTEGDVWSFTTKAPEQVPISLPPPPPPQDENFIVRGVLSSPRGQQVVLEDPGNKNAPQARVEVGEPMFGGMLIFVHPKGAVTERQDGTRRFHPLGVPLKDGRLLSEQEDPVVFDELAKLENRSAGINKE